MGVRNDRMDGARTVTMFTPRIVTAAKAHVCDGCGEIPINPGDTMMVSEARTPEGFSRRHYCIRCVLAIEVKKAHATGGSVAIQPGDLKMAKLASPFRKAWTRMAVAIHDGANQSEAIRMFADEMAIQGIGAPKTKIDRLAERMAGKKERRKTLKAEAKELREELRRLKESMKSRLMDLALWRDEAASRRLAYKIAATKGDEAAMAEADKGLVEALLAMQKVIEGQEDEA